ncbi:MAG TPA: TylF/MycF/NovP-related O-methyltransferase [Candidatus Sulfotelmatobacter sp.]|nr:TylF/MycF/NovP-related O-methyltransferase [Candidatus Sulfotelmatobacter sp.]
MKKSFLGFDADKCWDYENGFYLTSHLTRLSKILAHYELYKTIVDLPGHIVECGVYKGSSLLRFASFREVLESPYSRKIIGFDAFGRFPVDEQDENDRAFVHRFSTEGGDGISRSSLLDVLAHKGFDNIELVEGDICSTVPQYVAGHPELKIALLHIDVDIYRPTQIILDQLFDRVVPRGLVVLDDYGTVAGETQAIDEFLTKSKPQRIIEKLPIAHIPAYIRK